MLSPSQKLSSSYLLLKISFHHQLVTPFLSGASPPKKNPGSVNEISYANSVRLSP